VTTQLARVAQYFEKTRSDYELFWTGDSDLALHHGYYSGGASGHSAALIRMNEVLGGYARIAAGDHVLDAGSGYGGSAIWLARELGCSVVGVNLVAFQTLRAQRLAEANGISRRVKFLLADYARTPFPDASFDVVWGLESIVHAESQEAFVCEASRLLTPGGRLLIAEYTTRESPALSDTEQQLIASGLNGWAMTRILTPGKYAELAREHGFDEVITYDLTEAMRPSITHLGKLRVPTTSVRFLFPILELLARTRLSNDVRLRNIKGGYDFARAYLMGAWRYSAIVATKSGSEVEREDNSARQSGAEGVPATTT
jgi:cyclopropane fatty-acyl-phospholipid synthase-like methyltransferase